MINALTTKLEVEVSLINEIDQATQLAIIHKLPVMVVPHNLIKEAILNRIRRKGSFKIMTTVDCPKGESYGMTKLRGLTHESMICDGFEIMMSGGKSEAENKSEIDQITTFIKKHVSQNMEVRFVLGCATKDEQEISRMVSVMKNTIPPSLIRTDVHLRAQVTKVNAKTHTALVSLIRKSCGLPLKVSGNIDSITTISSCMRAVNPPQKFAVSLQQLQAIVKDIQRQPDELKSLLRNDIEVDLTTPVS